MDLHIKDVLRNYIKKDKKIGDAYYTQKIKDFWKSKLSQSIISRTVNLHFTKGKLYVKVDSAPLRNELFNNRKSLMSKINEHLDEDVVHVIDFS